MALTKDFPEFVLASASPRRRELLEQAGYRFRVVPPPLSEPSAALLRLHPPQLAESLAYFKARAVQPLAPSELILAADTIVAVGARIIGKPRDEQDAREILKTLSSTRHSVITGLAVLLPHNRCGAPGPQERFMASDETCVTMRPMSPEDIEQYIQSGEWRDKAGAYAIQETGDHFITKLEGSFSNVVGLPLELVDRLFAQVRYCL